MDQGAGNPAVTRVALLAARLGVLLRAAELESLGVCFPPFKGWLVCEWLFCKPFQLKAPECSTCPRSLWEE